LTKTKDGNVNEFNGTLNKSKSQIKNTHLEGFYLHDFSNCNILPYEKIRTKK